MKPFSEMGEAELAAALHSLRPEPRPAFAAELDERLAAGFPRRASRTARNPFARLLAWIGDGSRWHLLIPAGGAALAAIAVATVVLAGSNGSESALQIDSAGTAGSAAPTGPKSAEGSGTYGANAKSAPNRQPMESSAAGTTIAPAPAAPAAAAAPHRDVERGADIVIGTPPGEVATASSKVFEAVHAYNGVVVSSSTRDGRGTHAEATFELLIPSGKLGDAMAAFSQIGEVLSRHQTTTDITAPTVSTRERLQDSQARIDSLLAQLATTTTEAEREVVEAELRAERGHAARLKANLSNLNSRASLSRVTVRIESGSGALAPGGSSGGWGVGKALGDAGHLLSVAAGVTIVGLAALAPLLLLALLAWLAGRAWTRRARERALT
ncbi:MAG: DUF4349 domain-containing protein [Actinobacteria bacterium]|nr:DUF4349 domain-containing protein [Actinomycetota bacterium]